MPTVTPIYTDARSKRENIRRKAVQGVSEVFPVTARNYVISVENVRVDGKTYSPSQHKQALLAGRSLTEPVKGDLLLKDTSGKVVERETNYTLMNLPWFTDYHTFVLDGTEYSVSNQTRIKPGVYTRRKGNEELESAFNLGKGSNFKLTMEPSRGHFMVEYGTTRIPMYSVLKAFGVDDTTIGNYIGGSLLSENKSAYGHRVERDVDKLYQKLIAPGQQTASSFAEKQAAIQAYYAGTSIDPEVTSRTIGVSHSSVGATTILAAAKKLLAVFNQAEDTDDRDSAEFKTIHSVDDFIRERLALDGRNISRKMRNKLDTSSERPTLKSLVPTGTFTRPIRSFLGTSSLSSTPQQINPIEIFDSASKVTALGEGGITNQRAVPDDARQLHGSHLGIFDPVRTPESGSAGIDVRSSVLAGKDENNNPYAMLTNAKTGKDEYVAPGKLRDKTVAFKKTPLKNGKYEVLSNGRVLEVPKSQVDYYVPATYSMYSPATSLIPFLESIQGNRAVMGSKMSTQALPLTHRERPLIQVGNMGGDSAERILAEQIEVVAPEAGEVTKVTDSVVTLRGKSGQVHTLELQRDFPLASKTYIDMVPIVKVGDRVKKGDILTESNFTKDKDTALGRNLRVAYMPYHGLNSNDAVVISESASRSMTSQHMYKKVLEVDDTTIVDKRKYTAQFPNKFDMSQLRNVGNDGVVAAGSTLNEGDPIILAMHKQDPSATAAMLGQLHKSLVRPYRDGTLEWDHAQPAKVVDVVRSGKRITVTVKSEEPIAIGDKLSGRFGNKGVVARIVPDGDMIKDESGETVDLLLTSAGVVSRINPAQILETTAAKVADKTGKPIIIDDFTGNDNAAWTKKLLKDNKVKDKETVYDPTTGSYIPNIVTGKQYTYKLFKSTDTNFAGRGVGPDYDVNRQPAKSGGFESAKGLGGMEINALLAHGARNVLQETSTRKSERNDEFWRAVQLGHPVPQPETTFSYDKFNSMLQGAGINVKKKDNLISLAPLTDRDIDRMSSGEVRDAKMVRAKDLRPESGGLFDPVLTGGTAGGKWSHHNLPEPIVNPVFEESARRLMGLTGKAFKELQTNNGGAHIREELNKIDVDKKITDLKGSLDKLNGAKLDDAVKQIKYLQALKANELRPGDAYTLSKIPIVPPQMRPIMSSAKGDLLTSDANYLYRDAILASTKMKEMKEAGLPDELIRPMRTHLQDSVGAVFGLQDPVSPQLAAKNVKGFVKQISGSQPKHGFFQSKVMSKTQDLSGRGTAAPDPSLGMDEIGLPEDMAWKLYEPFIVKRMVGKGYSAMEAKEHLADKSNTARNALIEETRDRPVLFNRAPTLHRYSMVGAYPKLVPGKTIRTNPFVEEGQNLDYDGDALQIYTPVSDAAKNEVKNLTLSNLMLSDGPKGGDLLAFPQHEAIIGVFLATAQNPSGKRYTFKTVEKALDAYKRGEVKINDTVRIG